MWSCVAQTVPPPWDEGNYGYNSQGWGMGELVRWSLQNLIHEEGRREISRRPLTAPSIFWITAALGSPTCTQFERQNKWDQTRLRSKRIYFFIKQEGCHSKSEEWDYIGIKKQPGGATLYGGIPDCRSAADTDRFGTKIDAKQKLIPWREHIYALYLRHSSGMCDDVCKVHWPFSTCVCVSCVIHDCMRYGGLRMW
jgi:hypothetical protein